MILFYVALCKNIWKFIFVLYFAVITVIYVRCSAAIRKLDKPELEN